MDAVLQNFRRSFGPTTPFFQSLSLDPPVTMEELYRRADKFSTLEDNIRAASKTVIITTQSGKPAAKGPSEQKSSQGKGQKRLDGQSEKRKDPPQFTALNIAYDRLLPIIQDLPDFKWSPTNEGRSGPAQQIPTMKLSHGPDHETNHCQSLKFMVEKLVWVGHLRRYLREPTRGATATPPANMVVANTKNALGPQPAINFILGGSVDS